MGEDKYKRLKEDGQGAVSGEVLHGGEGDPLGGGVADLRPSDQVTEGVPEQDEEHAEDE